MPNPLARQLADECHRCRRAIRRVTIGPRNARLLDLRVVSATLRELADLRRAGYRL